MKLTHLLFAVLAILCVAGCESVPNYFYEAEQATHDAVAPEYLEMVDKKYPPDSEDEMVREQNKSRHATVELWEQTLAEAAKEFGDDPPEE
jgi:hypothetical protein